MRFNALPEFSREFKKLAKKYKSLPKDLEEFKRVLKIIPLGNTKHFAVLIRTENLTIIKARLFCKYLKGSSLRIVYAYSPKVSNIDFIEIYFKGDKEREDNRRIDDYVRRQ